MKKTENMKKLWLLFEIKSLNGAEILKIEKFINTFDVLTASKKCEFLETKVKLLFNAKNVATNLNLEVKKPPGSGTWRFLNINI